MCWCGHGLLGCTATPPPEHARLTAHTQAVELFLDTKYRQESVILVACVGEWWSWKCFARPPRLAAPTGPGGNSHVDDLDATHSEASVEYDGGHSRPRDTSPDPLLLIPLVDRNIDYDEQESDVARNAHEARPPIDHWSKVMLLGTVISNQRLWWLREHLYRLE